LDEIAGYADCQPISSLEPLSRLDASQAAKDTLWMTALPALFPISAAPLQEKMIALPASPQPPMGNGAVAMRLALAAIDVGNLARSR